MQGVRWILVRHAPAMSRDFSRWPDDRGRPLRPTGVEEFRQAAKGLSSLLTKRGGMSSSPLARTRQTAEMLQKSWGTKRVISYWKELEPDGSTLELFNRAKRSRVAGDLVMVSHEPLLSQFVGLCLFGESTSVLKFSKGGAVALDFPGEVRPGGGRLLWALSRRSLGRLRAATRSKEAEE